MGRLRRQRAEIVRDRERGQIRLARERLADRVQQHQLAREVEARRRLVEDEQRRVGDERAGEQDPLALALGAGDERAIGDVGGTDELERGARLALAAVLDEQHGAREAGLDDLDRALVGVEAAPERRVDEPISRCSWARG